jgi:hypothetical protein
MAVVVPARRVAIGQEQRVEIRDAPRGLLGVPLTARPRLPLVGLGGAGGDLAARRLPGVRPGCRSRLRLRCWRRRRRFRGWGRRIRRFGRRGGCRGRRGRRVRGFGWWGGRSGGGWRRVRWFGWWGGRSGGGSRRVRWFGRRVAHRRRRGPIAYPALVAGGAPWGFLGAAAELAGRLADRDGGTGGVRPGGGDRRQPRRPGRSPGLAAGGLATGGTRRRSRRLRWRHRGGDRVSR